MTITEAIKQVMQENGAPMTAAEAFRAIIAANLYEFHADNPAHIVRSQIRRHCQGLDFPSAAPTKFFKLIGDNRYSPLDQPHRQGQREGARNKECDLLAPKAPLADTLKELQALHSRYISELKTKIILDLKRLSPSAFESFSRRLLEFYGFHDMRITRVSSDGEIDGFGKLKVGLAHLNVAFQCKRWTKGNVQRAEVDKFRGAIQGDYEQGLFFTTATFSKGAINASIKRGRFPSFF